MLDLTNYLKSSFPLLYCETYEINRAVSSITVQEGYGLSKWDSINGLDNTGNLTSIPEFLEYLTTLNKRTAIIAENFNFFFEDESIQQMLLNYIPIFKNQGVCIVIIGAEHPKKFPNTLKKYIHNIEFPMPTVNDFKEIVKTISEQVNIEYDESIAEACIGLTYEEAENALYKSVVDTKTFDKNVIYQMKGDMLKSTGFMRYINPEPIENIGGLENLKSYVAKRLIAYDKPELNLPKLKAILLVGIPGTGKSLFAKALASIFDWPLIECDVNAMKGGIVGETEENTRLFCKTVDAYGNAVILLDELSLAFGGYTSGSVHETGGATSGMLGTLLTWMNDRTSPAIVIATSNDLNLPQAMLRAGRWSALFFIDFPSFNERKEIIQIMNKKWGSNLPIDDDFVNSLAEWSGAEIEQLAKDSLFEDYKEAAMGISLVRETKAEVINEVRKFGNTIRKANKGSMTKGLLTKKRTISIKEEGEVKKDFGIDEDFKSKIQRKILNKES